MHYKPRGRKKIKKYITKKRLYNRSMKWIGLLIINMVYAAGVSCRLCGSIENQICLKLCSICCTAFHRVRINKMIKSMRHQQTSRSEDSRVCWFIAFSYSWKVGDGDGDGVVSLFATETKLNPLVSSPSIHYQPIPRSTLVLLIFHLRHFVVAYLNNLIINLINWIYGLLFS